MPIGMNIKLGSLVFTSKTHRGVINGKSYNAFTNEYKRSNGKH